MPAVIVPDAIPKPKPKLALPAEDYRSAVVDSKEDSFSTLSTFHQGMRIRGDYYSRVAGLDQAPKSVDPNLPAVFDQLTLIKGLELRVSDQLNHSQSTEAHRGFDSTMSVIFPGVVTPEEGELFIFDMGNGRAAVGAIIQLTDRGSPYTESATKATMRVTRIMTADYEKILQSKVVDTFVYDQLLLRRGLTPLIRRNEVDNIRSLRKAYVRMANLYLRDFYSTEFKTLILPMQSMPTYDPYLVKFVLSIFEMDLSPTVGMIKPLGVDHLAVGNEYTVYDAIASCDDALLMSVGKRVGVTSISSYRARPALKTIYYSGISNVVIMTDDLYSNNTHLDVQVSSKVSLQEAGVRDKHMDAIIPIRDPGIFEDRPQEGAFIKRVVVDDYYVFSEAFYKGEGTLSVLEKLTHSLLKREPINLEELTQLAEFADKFNNLERFYYVPVVMALIKMAVGVAR